MPVKIKTKKRPDHPMGDEISSHPSFGSISWSRQQWGTHKAVLFQSEMSHQDVISVKVHRAELHRSLSRDWIFSKDTVSEVLLSPAQFAEFITSPNRGEGTPCTLNYTEVDGSIDLVEQESNYEKFKEEAAEDLGEIPGRLKDLLEQLDTLGQGKTVRKVDIREITHKVAGLKQHLLDNMPFLKAQFDEHMAKVVSDSKQEVEAYICNRIQDAGLEHLKSEAPFLLEKGNDLE